MGFESFEDFMKFVEQNGLLKTQPHQVEAFKAALQAAPRYRDFMSPQLNIDDIKPNVEDTNVGEYCWDDCFRRVVHGRIQLGQRVCIAMPGLTSQHVLIPDNAPWPSVVKVATFEAEVWELRRNTKVIVWKRVV